MSQVGPSKNEVIDCITGMGSYLYRKQVIARDQELELPDGTETEVIYEFIREDPGPYRFRLKREKELLRVLAVEGETGEKDVKTGEFFRVYPGRGIKNPGKGEGGISFLFKGFAGAAQEKVLLEAYDRGGIWDDGVNMEAFRFEPQVAGTYYADAYGAYTFAWMASSGYGPEYGEAAAAALDFIRRIYPRYEPAYLDGMPHSDFKNPAYLETVEEFMEELASPEDLKRWRSLYPEMIINEEYSPTNVYALRYHWWSAYNKYCPSFFPEAANRFNPEELVSRLREDQTADGLVQDNNYSEISFGGYSDAHDLTYHLYALSWLARGFDYLVLPAVMEIFLKGARFSLSLTTPGGEASYLGRSANNIYHLISGIYVFLRAAQELPEEAPRFYRAARLIFDYLKPYRLPEKNYPVGLNNYPEELMGWSHCQTPYNGTNAYFFIRCLPLLPDEKTTVKEEKLLLEEENLLFYPQSRHAAFSNSRFYAVIFGGSDISPYPHSGVHNTGVAGLAMLGRQGAPSLLPILEQSLREGEWSTSDLPDIVVDEDEVEVPLGRGKLSHLNRSGKDYLLLELEYGNFRVRQQYTPEDDGILLHSTVTCLRQGLYKITGAPGLAVQTGEDHLHSMRDNGFIYEGPAGSYEFTVLENTLNEGEWEIMDESSTGRGWHRKIAWSVEKEFKEQEEHKYSAKITLKIK